MRKTDYFPFNGGENHATPALSIPPGELSASLNYELHPEGGYRRVDGIERFDGRPAPSDLLRSSYATEELWITAIEARRTLIGTVPGEGDILGVWYYNDISYAFRNKVGGATAGMYESTGSGWSEVDLGEHLNFDTGTQEIFVGDTVTGATSGNTAVVTRVDVNSGTWSGNDAAGEIHYASKSGPFTDGESLTVSAVPKANAATPALTTHTLSPGGRYEFVNHNFYGHSGSLTMYGVNGVDQGFFYDGTYFSTIHTGMTDDTPAHLFAHKKHLFFAFAGGSVQHSSLGEPLIWSALTGAAELAIGDEISGFELATKDSLAIFGRNSTHILYGSDSSDWNLAAHSVDSGAVEHTVQRLKFPLYLDDRGVANLATTDAYGDFKSNSLSKKMDSIIASLRGQATAALKVRNKDQYRLYFSDNTCMTFTFVENKLTGIMRHDYDRPVLCACSSETSTGEEVMFFGSDDGYVYQIDKGPSFDGGVVDAWIRPVFNHFKSPEHKKRFFKVVLEINANEQTTLYYIPTFDYGADPTAEEGTIDVTGGGGFWDVANWGEFYYDTQVISTAYGYLTGVGKNFSLYIRSEETYETPHIIQGAIIHYSRKGLSK